MVKTITKYTIFWVKKDINILIIKTYKKECFLNISNTIKDELNLLIEEMIKSNKKYNIYVTK